MLRISLRWTPMSLSTWSLNRDKRTDGAIDLARRAGARRRPWNRARNARQAPTGRAGTRGATQFRRAASGSTVIDVRAT